MSIVTKVHYMLTNVANNTWTKVSYFTHSDDVKFSPDGENKSLTTKTQELEDAITDNRDSLAEIGDNLTATVDGNFVPFQFRYDSITRKYGYTSASGNFIPFLTDYEQGENGFDLIWYNGDQEKTASLYNNYTGNVSPDPIIPTPTTTMQAEFKNRSYLASFKPSVSLANYDHFIVGFLFNITDSANLPTSKIYYKFVNKLQSQPTYNNVSTVYLGNTVTPTGIQDQISTTTLEMHARRFYITDTQFVTFDCTDSTKCIPIAIYGCKTDVNIR